jgi:hypothetical protein
MTYPTALKKAPTNGLSGLGVWENAAAQEDQEKRQLINSMYHSRCWRFEMDQIK